MRMKLYWLARIGRGRSMMRFAPFRMAPWWKDYRERQEAKARARAAAKARKREKAKQRKRVKFSSSLDGGTEADAISGGDAKLAGDVIPGGDAITVDERMKNGDEDDSSAEGF